MTVVCIDSYGESSMIRACGVWSLVLLLSAVACSRGSDTNPTHSFRIFEEDGVTIAETIGGPKYQEPLFTFEEMLILRQDPENEDSMLYRAGMFLRGDDGRYYVADSGAERIAVFDENGGYLFDFGQQGYGPGDFASLGWLNFVNGELHIYDMTVERVSRFSLEGELLGMVSTPLSIAPVSGYLFRMHLTPEYQPVVITQQDDYRSGEVRRRRCGFLYSVEGDSLLAAQSDWVLSEKVYPVGDQFNSVNLPYRPSPQVCYSPRHGFIMGTGAEPVLDRCSLDGRRSQIRFDEEQVPVTAEDRRRARASYDERIAEAEGARKAMLKAEKDVLEWPDHRPFWQQFEVDDQGFIWLDVYRTYQEMLAEGMSPLFMVLSPEGEYLGQVRMPSHSGAKGFSNGYLMLVRYEPETGEQFPTVYRILPAVRGLKYPD